MFSSYKNTIKSVLNIFPYIIEYDRGLVKNFFKTNFTKTVLVSYLLPETNQFEKLHYNHTNIRECFTALEIFKKLGYNIDIINYASKKHIDYTKYSILYGFGDPYENSFYQSHKLHSIGYMTGCNPWLSNDLSTFKVKEFHQRTGILAVSSSRVTNIRWNFLGTMSDVVIVLGNELTEQTLLRRDSSVRSRVINSFFNDVGVIDLEAKNFEQAKTNFLWFGSSGLLHKGLDICLDIFIKRPEITLHICGASEQETDFWKYYEPLIKNKTNIINHGFLEIRSEKFKDILMQCGTILAPSVSEGGAPALVQVCATGGLLPIFTKLSGVNLQQFGTMIEIPCVAELEAAIDLVLLKSDTEMKKNAKKTINFVQGNYSFEQYKNTLENYISDEINHIES